MNVPIPKNIYSYEHKVIGNFTKRQAVCGGIALLIIFPVFISVLFKTGSPRLATLLGMMTSFPVLACGVFKKDGQYLDQILRYRCRQRFRYPRKRKFVMNNLYEIIEQNQKEYEAANEKQRQQDEECRDGKKGRRPFPPVGKKAHGPGKHPV